MSTYDFSKVNFADPEIQRRLSKAFEILLSDNSGEKSTKSSQLEEPNYAHSEYRMTASEHTIQADRTKLTQSRRKELRRLPTSAKEGIVTQLKLEFLDTEIPSIT